MRPLTAAAVSAAALTLTACTASAPTTHPASSSQHPPTPAAVLPTDPGLARYCPALLRSITQATTGRIGRALGSSLGDLSAAILHRDFNHAETGNHGYPQQVRAVTGAAARLSYLVTFHPRSAQITTETAIIRHGCTPHTPR